jgi:hypothetical protein
MLKSLERLKITVNKHMADLRPDRLKVLVHYHSVVSCSAVCASMSAAGAARRGVQLQTWDRKHSPHPSCYSILLPLHVLHRPHSTQE